MTDIALDKQGDLVINRATGEILLLKSNKDSVLQRKTIELNSYPASLVEAPYEGVLISRETTLTQTSLSKALRFYEKVFGEDEDIDPESVTITPVLEDGVYKFHTSFQTLDGEAIDGF